MTSSSSSSSAYLLAFDQGTSSSRSIVFDDRARIVASAQAELPQIYPRPGWVEHDPQQIWQTQLDTARQALASAGIAADAVAAVGITNQRETTVLWNRRTGQPVHHAIVWQDRRAEPLCAELRAAGHAELIAQKDRPRDRRVFLRHQAALAARPCAGRTRAGRTRRTRIRHRR